MDAMVNDLQKLIRTIRLEASIERCQGYGAKADIMEDNAAAFERILLKYTAPAPIVPGYPRGFGWRSTAINLFSLAHKA